MFLKLSDVHVPHILLTVILLLLYLNCDTCRAVLLAIITLTFVFSANSYRTYLTIICTLQVNSTFRALNSGVYY